MKHLLSIRARFAVWTASLLLITFVLFGGFIYIRTAQSLAESVDNVLRLTASQVISGVDIQDGELVSIDSFLAVTPSSPLIEQDISFRIINSSGHTLQEYGPYRTFPPPQITFTASNRPGSFVTLTDAATQQAVRVYTTPIVDEGQVIGTLQVAQNLSSIRQTLSQLLTTLSIGGPLLIVIAGLGGYVLAARVLDPIDKIILTAQHISAEELSARLNLPNTDDEVGRLAATFDSMLARLEKAFRRERRFTADASHELRTPLAAMQTILGSTLARQRSSAECEHVLIDLGKETARLHTLVEGLLHLTQSDATQPMMKETVNLSNVLADVSDSLRPLAEAKGLALNADIRANLTIMGDSDALIRLFVNLIANAITYTEQGQISVTANPATNGFIEVAIADTGIGIQSEHMPQIFERFYRVEQSRSTAGIGLGLAIALNVARTHNGTITVSSEFGKGSCFTVQLAAE